MFASGLLRCVNRSVQDRGWSANREYCDACKVKNQAGSGLKAIIASRRSAGVTIPKDIATSPSR